MGWGRSGVPRAPNLGQAPTLHSLVGGGGNKPPLEAMGPARGGGRGEDSQGLTATTPQASHHSTCWPLRSWEAASPCTPPHGARQAGNPNKETWGRPAFTHALPPKAQFPAGHALLRPFPQLTMMAAASSSRRFGSKGKQRLHFWAPERPAGASARPLTGNGAKARGVRKTRGQQRG